LCRWAKMSFFFPWSKGGKGGKNTKDPRGGANCPPKKKGKRPLTKSPPEGDSWGFFSRVFWEKKNPSSYSAFPKKKKKKKKKARVVFF